MSIDQLSARLRTQRTKRRTLDLATITVKRVEPSAGRRRFAGRVLIDRQQVGYLVGDEPRTFEVETGDHTITLYFGRRPAILSSPRRATSTASVSLGAGERADFACGIRPDVARLWAQAQTEATIRATVFAAAVGLSASAGSLLAPYLRQAVALALFRLPVYGPLIPICYALVSPVLCWSWFALLAGWIVRRSTDLLRDQTDEALLSRIGFPYYLERFATA
jgi:hypothetical protein